MAVGSAHLWAEKWLQNGFGLCDDMNKECQFVFTLFLLCFFYEYIHSVKFCQANFVLVYSQFSDFVLFPISHFFRICLSKYWFFHILMIHFSYSRYFTLTKGVLPMAEAFIRFDNVKKVYQAGEVAVTALHDASFDIERGEICVIVGESGAGKTTLLNILGGMDSLTEGSVTVDGAEISGFSSKELTQYRRTDVGFVFQFYNLIPNLTALENVEIAAKLSKDALDARFVLEQVGLKDRAGNFPAQLSGGEQQRVAIARALAKNPKLLLCDEPTGALDYNTGKAILKLLQDTSRQQDMTVIIITHNKALCDMADRVIRVKSGTVQSVTRNDCARPIEEIEW